MTTALPQLTGSSMRISKLIDWWLAGLRGSAKANKVSSTLPMLALSTLQSPKKLQAAAPSGSLKTARRKGAGVIVPAEAWLSFDVDLPDAAREELREMAAFEIAERTPLSADRVWFDLEDQGSGSFAVHLVPKRVIVRAQKTLEASGITPRFLVSEDKQTIALARPHNRAGRMAALAGLGGLVALGLGAGWLLYDQSSRIASVEAALAEVMPGARKTRAIEAQIRALHDSVSAEAASQPAQTSTVRIIEELTQRIPDSGWLSEIVISDGTLRIKGRAFEVEPLVRDLAASDVFSTARLSGTVNTEVSGLSQFEIIAEVSK